ncbi:cytochrome P450 [Daedaleopsis nitida]|nr:cytochrome P450 [Daedaleopsis nitida]
MSPLQTSLHNTVLILITIGVITYAVSTVLWRRRSHGLPPPPGPKGMPVLGNVVHMQQPQVWNAHAQLCKVYGDVVHVPVLGHSVVILGSANAIFDLLHKRSAATSDRQQSPTIELSGQGFNFSLMSYGAKWKRYRKEFARRFPPMVPTEQLESQREHARMFLKKVLNDPEHLVEHIRYTFAASVVKSVYGIEVAETDDKNLAEMEKTLEGLEAITPGRFLVQFLPILEHAPHWLPIIGKQMKQLAVWHESSRTVKQALFDLTKQQVEKGIAPPSMVASMLRDLEGMDAKEVAESENVTKDLALTAFEGSIETTFATVQFFFVAMWLHPEVQRKAQAELDVVVGPHRLPEHSDMASLPYITAIVKECLRWRNVAPISLPHCTSEDLEYRGYFIPKGTTLVPLTWECLHNSETYPEPLRFNPDRFIRDGKLDYTQRDPADFAFGFGRRVCPGMAYGEAALFINVAFTLHAFELLPPLDESGNVVTAEPKVAGLFTSFPVECRCRVRLRVAQVESLICEE